MPRQMKPEEINELGHKELDAIVKFEFRVISQLLRASAAETLLELGKQVSALRNKWADENLTEEMIENPWQRQVFMKSLGEALGGLLRAAQALEPEPPRNVGLLKETKWRVTAEDFQATFTMRGHQVIEAERPIRWIIGKTRQEVRTIMKKKNWSIKAILPPAPMPEPEEQPPKDAGQAI